MLPRASGRSEGNRPHRNALARRRDQRSTVADICLYCYIDQLCDVGQPIPEQLGRLNAWFERVGKRPGAEPSIWRERPMGMRG